MLVALGLGNPGGEYAETRHNVGKRTVASLASKLRLCLLPGRGDFHYAWDHSCDLVLVVPAAYVNSSGVVAVQAIEQFRAGTSELLIVCDDFSLPLGTIRIRRQGSDGGHNGLASIIFALASQDVGRLRMGVGTPPEGLDPADFVLARFSPDEEASIERMEEIGCEAILAVATQGIDRAMNLYNKRGEKDDSGEGPNGKGARGGSVEGPTGQTGHE